MVPELNLPAVSAAKQSDPIVQMSVQFKNTVKDCARRVLCLDVLEADCCFFAVRGARRRRGVAVPRRAVLAQRDGGGAAESGHRMLPAKCARCRCSKRSRRCWRSRALRPSALDQAAGSKLKEVRQVLPVCNFYFMNHRVSTRYYPPYLSETRSSRWCPRGLAALTTCIQTSSSRSHVSTIQRHDTLRHKFVVRVPQSAFRTSWRSRRAR